MFECIFFAQMMEYYGSDETEVVWITQLHQDDPVLFNDVLANVTSSHFQVMSKLLPKSYIALIDTSESV